MAASVSSLDQDMRNIRSARYTLAASNEVRSWIETTLNEPLPSGDLLEALKDGVVLCKLANLVLPSPSIKYKTSSMPFIQMENISHFLRVCEMSPLDLPAHDRFLTVDLYESKDPAQVLQCLGAFSRRAHSAKPSVFRTTIGPKGTGGGVSMSPANTGGPKSPIAIQPHGDNFGRTHTSPKPTSSPAGTGPVSSWSKKSDEANTAPAWNIHQYGYMGGASQGNQGIAFGARRQITSQAPDVPSLAEKERIRKEKAAREQLQQQQAEEEKFRRAREREEEEERARAEEERRWEEETRRQREAEKREVEEQKRQWEEQERRWKEAEEQRRKEGAQIQVQQRKLPERPRIPSSSILRGQTLSQYQREQATTTVNNDSQSLTPNESPEYARVRELEKQLEEARERERQYHAEREERLKRGSEPSRPNSTQMDQRPQSAAQSDHSWVADERESLRREWQEHRDQDSKSSAPLSSQVEAPPSLPSRPLPQPIPQSADQAEDEAPPSLPRRSQQSTFESPSPSLPSHDTTNSSHQPAMIGSSRPLSGPKNEPQPYTMPSQNRTDRFLATNKPPVQSGPRISTSQEAGDTSLEQQRDFDARVASQRKTKAGGWASKSLLEREMERERERQREWEADQEKLKSAPRDATQGTGAGQTWDVNQYGYTGGDNMNRGSGAGSGINFGGRRQILGPREMSRK